MLRRALLLTSLAMMAGCAVGGGDDDDAAGDDDDATECAYPSGAVEPMELDEVLFPYSWPEALTFDRSESELSLERAHCNDDEIDWSPFDVLLFVSYPAW